MYLGRYMGLGGRNSRSEKKQQQAGSSRPVDPTVPDRPHRCDSARSITVISMGSVLLPADL
eukprot:COSAG01_NODE_51701_length_352_cov_2.853755_2_plen_60_part_01